MTSALVYADAFERWGPREGPELERMSAEVAAVMREHAEVTSELVRAARESDRAVVAAWAEAHIGLLEHVASTTADQDLQRTARRQTEEWRKVARGELECVDESGGLVEVDAAQYAGYFGSP